MKLLKCTTAHAKKNAKKKRKSSAHFTLSHHKSRSPAYIQRSRTLRRRQTRQKMADCVTPGGVRRIRDSIGTPLSDVSVQVRTALLTTGRQLRNPCTTGFFFCVVAVVVGLIFKKKYKFKKNSEPRRVRPSKRRSVR